MTGLSEGLHGFHIHTDGDVSGSCTDAGGHYNPFGLDHGARTAEVRHVGCLGNIYADADGNAEISFTDPLVMLYGADDGTDGNIMARSCVVHAGEDDLGLGGDASSLANGNAGSRVACGTVTEMDENDWITSFEDFV